MGLSRALVDTRSAADTPIGEELHLPIGHDRLRVVTPLAAQIAALKEHGGPNARTVVNREALYAAYDHHAFRRACLPCTPLPPFYPSWLGRYMAE
jgi:hypothetical protein